MKKVNINDEMLKAAQSSAIKGTRYLLEVVASWLREKYDVAYTHSETLAMTVATLNPRFDSVMSRQRMWFVHIPFSQTLASGTWMLCSAPVG